MYFLIKAGNYIIIAVLKRHIINEKDFDKDVFRAIYYISLQLVATEQTRRDKTTKSLPVNS